MHDRAVSARRNTEQNFKMTDSCRQHLSGKENRQSVSGLPLNTYDNVFVF